MPTYLRTYLPTYLPTYIHTYIQTYIQLDTRKHKCKLSVKINLRAHGDIQAGLSLCSLRCFFLILGMEESRCKSMVGMSDNMLEHFHHGGQGAGEPTLRCPFSFFGEGDRRLGDRGETRLLEGLRRLGGERFRESRRREGERRRDGDLRRESERRRDRGPDLDREGSKRGIAPRRLNPAL